MSATICWKPVTQQDGYLSFGWPSRFIAAMRFAFGEYPWKLGSEQLRELRGMAATVEPPNDNPYQLLIDLIQARGQIEVWPEY